jgi:hypothetical protein
MADTLCGYPDRDEVIVTYLYDDMDAAERATFDAHLQICARCRSELSELRSVRDDLAGWAVASPQSSVVSRKPSVDGWNSSVDGRPLVAFADFPRAASGRRSWWRDMPAWAQVAAALVFVGVSAGLANLDVRYDREGLTVRTGWSRRAPAVRADAPAAVANQTTPPWRADLVALEEQLRGEFHAASVGSAAAIDPLPRPAATDAELLRRVRSLIETSEKRQQTELALRIAGVMNQVNAQRNADLLKIDSVLGTIQDRTDAKLLRQKAAFNQLLVGATQRQ